MGVPGSAFATLLARIFSMAAVLIRLRKKDLEIALRNYFSIRPDWREICRILNIGIPSGIENGMFQFGEACYPVNSISDGDNGDCGSGNDQYF